MGLLQYPDEIKGLMDDVIKLNEMMEITGD
jgi:hypothetical protein